MLRPKEKRSIGLPAGISRALAEAFESGRLTPTVFVMGFGCRIAFAGGTPNPT